MNVDVRVPQCIDICQCDVDAAVRNRGQGGPADHPAVEPGDQPVVSWFCCLADPTRIQILRLLATRDAPMTVGDIVQRVGVGQSTVSQVARPLGPEDARV